MKNNHTILSEIYDLLIEASQEVPDAEAIEHLCAQVSNWDEVVNSAYMHGIFPLVYKVLKSSHYLSDSIKTDLKRVNFDISRRNILMTGELIKILQLFEANGISALAIKGPVLSQIIHGDITQRQYSDLDILIEPNQMYRAVELLSGWGYVPEHPIKFLKNKTLLKVGKDFPVVHEGRNVLIEFHWKLFLDRHIKKSKIDLFSGINYHCVINNTSVATLELGAMLLYLLLHGSKHYWERLEWIVDIDRLIRYHGDEIDWERVSTIACEMEIEHMFYLGLAVTHEVYKTPLNESILSYIHTDKHIIKSKDIIIHEIKSDTIKIEQTGLVSLESLNKIFLMNDGTSSRLREYLLTLFQIKELDVYMVNLPNFLSPLYYGIRLYRIFKLNVLKLK